MKIKRKRRKKHKEKGYKVTPLINIFSHCRSLLSLVKVFWQGSEREEEEEERAWMARVFLMLANGQFATRMPYLMPCAPI